MVSAEQVVAGAVVHQAACRSIKLLAGEAEVGQVAEVALANLAEGGVDDFAAVDLEAVLVAEAGGGAEVVAVAEVQALVVAADDPEGAAHGVVDGALLLLPCVRERITREFYAVYAPEELARLHYKDTPGASGAPVCRGGGWLRE